jgi:hypothetical protein
MSMTRKKSKTNGRKTKHLDYFDRRGGALDRVIAAYKKGDDASDELNKALDALTLAHICATFGWADGPLKL